MTRARIGSGVVVWSITFAEAAVTMIPKPMNGMQTRLTQYCSLNENASKLDPAVPQALAVNLGRLFISRHAASVAVPTRPPRP